MAAAGYGRCVFFAKPSFHRDSFCKASRTAALTLLNLYDAGAAQQVQDCSSTSLGISAQPSSVLANTLTEGP